MLTYADCRDEACEMRVACLQNAAAACLKLNRFDECIDFCSDVIDTCEEGGVSRHVEW